MAIAARPERSRVSVSRSRRPRARAAGLSGPDTLVVTTVHELQVRPAGSIPVTGHGVPVDLVVTPERVVDCRPGRPPRAAASVQWDELTEEKIAAIPLLGRLRP